MWGHKAKAAIYQPGRKPLFDTKLAGTLILGFPAVRSKEKQIPVPWATQSMVVCWQLELTDSTPWAHHFPKWLIWKWYPVMLEHHVLPWFPYSIITSCFTRGFPTGPDTMKPKKPNTVQTQNLCTSDAVMFCGYFIILIWLFKRVAYFHSSLS